MSYFRTALLLAGLTALFMGVGFLIGGKGGAMIALVVAAAMNLFTYWNSRPHGAVDVRRPGGRPRHARPISISSSPSSPRRARLPMPRVFLIDEAQPNAFATGRNPDNAAVAVTVGLMQQIEPRGTRRRHRPRARAYQAITTRC